MVQHHRPLVIMVHAKKDGDERQRLYHLHAHHRSPYAVKHAAYVFSVGVSCLLLLVPGLFFLQSPSADERPPAAATRERAPACAAVPDDAICCDRSAFRTDVCTMRGDVRTAAKDGNSILLLLNSSSSSPASAGAVETIRPYTRKWEESIMSTIDELKLRTVVPSDAPPACDVNHDVPAIVFSTGGYTGNVYHEFNDGIIPLYITARRFNRKVVFVILEYHDWWMTKYEHIVSKLSDYPPVDFAGDNRTHCFRELTVGLNIHDELSVDPSRMHNNESIQEFRRMLDDAFAPRVRGIAEEEAPANASAPAADPDKPKMVIISRRGSRAIENEDELVKFAEAIGFAVTVLLPRRDTELAKLYSALNASDVMVGVHGAALTHFLFMRPGAVFIQVVPLGTDWAAETYYGEPAARLGLRYVPYKILPHESSLSRRYAAGDPVLRDPASVNARGWQVTKRVYLEGQSVTLDMRRFGKRLDRARRHFAALRRRRAAVAGDGVSTGKKPN